MSAADIADNRWEREAAKPEIFTPIGMLQIAMVGAFALFFAGVVLVALASFFVGSQESDIERRFREAQMRDQSAAASPAVPAAAPAAVPNPAAVPPAGQPVAPAGQPAAVPNPAQ